MERLKWPYALLLCTYCTGLFVLSHQSKLPIPTTGLFSLPGIDKVAHAILYAGLAMCFSLGLQRSNEVVRPWVQCFIPLIFAILYGLSDEIHQLFVPKRSFDWWDLCADGVGASVAQWIGYKGMWKRTPIEMP